MSDFRRIYKLFVITVIFLILLSQGIIQYFIYLQKFDANRINIAGRQRMLSQKITKTILQIHATETIISDPNIKELENLINLFVKSQKAILEGNKELEILENNSELVIPMFEALTPHSNFIINYVSNILEEKRIDRNSFSDLFAQESEYLKKMDQIVYIYSNESVKKSSNLQLIELILAFLTVIVIILEIGILYRPIILKLNEDNNKLSQQTKLLGEFSYLLSHKVRKHTANLFGLIKTINTNNSTEINEYFQYVEQSINELDKVSKDLSKKYGHLENYISKDFDELEKKITFEKLRSIILIDDDKITNVLTKKILLKKNPDAQIEIFYDGISAIKYLENLITNNRILPLVFLDLNMPKMNGWEFLDEIAARKISLPVYILTSSIDKNDIEKARTYKTLKGFLTKPLNIEEIPNFQ